MKRLFNFTLGFGLVIFFLTNNLIALDPRLGRFTAAKEAQAREIASAQTNPVPSLVWSYFDAVKADDWKTATNLAARLREASGYYSLPTDPLAAQGLQSGVWETISETIGAHEQFHDWDNKLLHRYGNDIIKSIPRGSIYFGGTDPGRFVITALCESHRQESRSLRLPRINWWSPDTWTTCDPCMVRKFTFRPQMNWRTPFKST